MPATTALSRPRPPSSQGPVFITAGRPIVILPKEYTLPSGCDFLQSGPVSSSEVYSRHCDSPAPLIVPVNDVEVASAVPIAGAIEFPDVQQIVPEPLEVKRHNKEEEATVCTELEHASLDIDSLKVNRYERLSSSLPVTELGVTTPLGVTPACKETRNPNIRMQSQFPFPGREQNLDQLQPPLQRSEVWVSPLIMSAYEENKEKLDLDDSDSELEMPESNNKDTSCQYSESDVKCQSNREDHIANEIGESFDGTTVAIAQVLISAVTDGEPKANVETEEEGQSHDTSNNSGVLDQDEPLPSGDELESISACAPPRKRAKVLDHFTGDIDSLAFGGRTSMLTQPSHEFDSDCCAEPSHDSCGQAVPYVPLPISAPLKDISENSLPVLPPTVADHSLRLQIPHEPAGCVASDGKDTANQTLPMESAREHAMVPKFVRCADEHNFDRDEPNDEGNGSHLKVPLPTLDLSLGKITQDQQANEFYDFVPGQTIVESKTEPQVKEALEDMPVSFDIPVKTPLEKYAHLALSTTVESAQVITEHQIVPDEPISNSPFSSQSLYTDFDQKPKLRNCSTNSQNESNIRLFGNHVVLAMKAVDERQIETASVSYSDDQAFPESPSQRNDCYSTSYGSDGDHSSYSRLHYEQSGACSGHSVAQNLFGFQSRKHTPQTQGNYLSSFIVVTLNIVNISLSLSLSLSRRSFFDDSSQLRQAPSSIGSLQASAV